MFWSEYIYILELKNAFLIRNHVKTITFSTIAESDKKEWMQAIQFAIDQTLDTKKSLVEGIEHAPTLIF